MKFQFLTLTICIVATGTLQNFASAQSSGFSANTIKSDVIPDVVSEVSQADSSQIVSDIGESTYFDSQQYVADGDSTSRVDSFDETLPKSSTPETEYKGAANFVGFRPNRTFTILGGWDLESMDADLSDFDNILPEDEVRSDRSNFAISIALGRRHRPWLRSESEIAVRDFGFNSLLSGDGTISVDRTFDTRVFSLMRNAILQWNNSSRFTPYGGMGIGVSYIDFEEEFSVSENLDRSDSGDRLALIAGDDTVFTWQAIGGVATRIGENVNFITEYRYFATADITLNGSAFGTREFDSQNLFFGLTVDF